ncbi:putative repeat protein (TIGR01451 family)/choice-of-anchor A domain-containing protein [Paenibacillus cellulosilyticus]|uniref:Putative repeat protein (TIGR01451 family)/choice-of-anchor A domain-containing protein n=1 Tax=Paenibacillus cellulosilyticus TaxID=375489 RepID=A0A2V2YMF6_9BACL|nr:choice-of-anchor A family protein [Paenibacillus cellulosilyticus]PWV95328.1 putative repeat protein (TIGR01451 family)/choice-of-anchor A domain-containing protein [Paenibacillus cellulosilyticus]QKS44059.1 choice-of-anchor A family protein [Paenibacillus cellulosilyticus]
MACASLGSASDFSIFLFGNYNGQNTAIRGRAAVGGSVTLTDQSFGTDLPVSTTRADLIIGGDCNIIRGVNNGNTVIRPTSTVINYTMVNNNGVLPQPIVDSPIDFDLAAAYLECVSIGWGDLPANGTASNLFGTLNIVCSDPARNVVTFNGNDVDGSGLSLESASVITLQLPVGSTVLINVLGDNVGFGNYQVQVNGGSPDPSVGATILWNFPQATVLRNGNGIITGSILAPFAAMTANGSAQLNGQLIAGSYDGTNGLITPQLVFFTGCLPEVTTCGVTALTVTKLVNGAASFAGTPGTPLTFSVLVENPSTLPISNIVIKDDLLGIDQIVPVLQAGESYPFVVNSEVQSGMAGTLYTNTVTVTSDNAPAVSAQASITITALPVQVQLTKSASQTDVRPGDIILYQFDLSNQGNSDLINVRLVDTTIGLDLSLPTFFSGTLTQQSFTMPVDAVPGSTFTNTARLTADNLPSPGFIESSVSIKISSIPVPAADFRKLASDTAPLPGEEIQYYYVIQNETDSDLHSLVLHDPMLDFTRTLDVLSPRTTIVLAAPFIIPVETTAGTSIVNTATLTGSFGTITSSAAITVGAMLSLLVTKDVNQTFVNPGGTLDYTLRVLNSGNESLNHVSIIDSLTGFQTVIASLPAGQSQDFQAPYTVPIDSAAGSVITNTVLAQAAGVTPETAQASVVVTTIPLPPNPPIPPTTPSITVQAAASLATVSPDETVTFTGTVTNISAVSARNIILQSPLFQFAAVLELLEPGATLTLNGNFTVPKGTAPGTTITATLSANSIMIPLQEASASCVVLPQAALALTNIVNENEVVQGETVIYTVTGVNTGNVMLHHIVISATILLRHATIEMLDAGTFVRAFFNKTVTEQPGSIFCNTFNASAADIGTVSATSCYTVYGLLLRMQANTAIVQEGGTIQYTVTVRNPTPASATGVVFRNRLPDHTELIAGSVTLNGNTVPDGLLTAGIPLPSLAANASATVTYAVIVLSDPTGSTILNRAEASFVFPSTSRGLSGTSFSNVVQVAVEEHEE